MRDNTERRLAEESLERANQELQRRIAEETARRSAEASLTHALADFQMLMDSMTDCAIVLLDKTGGIVDWNRGAENILQFRRDEVMGRHLDFIHTPEDLERQSLQDELQCARLKGRSVEDKWLVRKNGERFFSSGILQPMLDEAGQLRGFAEIMRDITKRKLAEEEANYLANHDLLTGLPNRASFSTRLHHELARAKRYEKTFAIQLLDLNRFKFINDTLGHQAGDLLLQQVAARLSSCVRETDMVARVGGDEFVVIQTDLRTVGEAGLLAKKIIKELSQPFKLEDSEVYSGASIGITIFPRDADNASQLLKNADIAMYRAKSLKHQQYEYFTEELGAKVEERKILEDKLRISIATEGMEIYYQPQIDLKSWQITSVEALLRWKSPDMQVVSVSDLVGMAEENGSIVQISKWVLQAVCHQVKQWRESSLPSFHVAVNLSPLQVRDPNFLEFVRKIFDEYGIQPGWIEMEITERLLLENMTESVSVLEQLKSMGVLISVDDFGTGYSALGYLRDYPIDIIKIDKSLIENLPNSREVVAIVSGILGVVNNLGLKVIAEGVETIEQLAFLKAHECTGAQGYLFQPAVSADELARLMKDGHWSHMNPGDLAH